MPQSPRTKAAFLRVANLEDQFHPIQDTHEPIRVGSAQNGTAAGSGPAPRRYASSPRTQSSRTGEKISNATQSSRDSTLCGTLGGMHNDSPAQTTICSVGVTKSMAS